MATVAYDRNMNMTNITRAITNAIGINSPGQSFSACLDFSSVAFTPGIKNTRSNMANSPIKICSQVSMVVYRSFRIRQFLIACASIVCKFPTFDELQYAL